MKRFQEFQRFQRFQRFVGFVGFLVFAGLAAACSSRPPEDTRDYATRIAADRSAKDDLFRRDNDPIPDAKKAGLLPLSYFPIDPEYDVPASLEPSDDQTIGEMKTS